MPSQYRYRFALRKGRWHPSRTEAIDSAIKAVDEQARKMAQLAVARPNLIDTATESDQPAERWDSRRTDFWNHPRLWDRVRDPFKQMCWEMVR